MTAITWPTAYLPAWPLWSGYSQQSDPGILRTDMDSGLARQRRRFINTLSTVSVRWAMTPAQLLFFKSWMASQVGGGAAFFLVTLRLDDGTREVEARFVGKQKIAPAGTAGWVVDAQLEVKEAPGLIDADVIEVVLVLGADAVIGAAAAIDGVSLAPAFFAWDAGFGV